MRRSWWALGALVLALGVWLTPRGLSLYHQEQGGRLLYGALAAEGGDTIGGYQFLLWEPLTVEEARGLAEQAAARFRAAVETDKANGQAYRWLGRVSLLLDDPEGAVEAFSAYARLRPKNPLGWWELGLAYDRLVRRVEGAVEVAFAPKLNGEGRWDIIGAAPPMTVPLSMAAIETPDVPIDTPYCGQGEMPQSCFVASAAWEMPDAPEGQPAGWWLPEEPVRRAVLFMHPPSRATFTVTLPVTPTALVFWMGIDPAAWPWLGDGVVYRVWVDGEEVFERTLTPEAAREGWWPGKVDLGPWAGRAVRLTLETDPGPAGDGQGDWAGWGEVRLVEAEAADAVLADPVRRAVAAWREGGGTVQQLIEAGAQAQLGGHYRRALLFYRMAGVRGKIDADLPDPSYVVIESFVTASAWSPCPWCENTDGRFETYDGVLEMAYQNNPAKRDGFAYLSVPNIHIGRFSGLLLRIKGNPGTLLTMEVVIDGQRSRPFNYRSAPQEWEVWTVPLGGKVLNEILIGIGELEPVPVPEEYHLFIDWIALQ